VIINTNIAALRAYRHLKRAHQNVAKSMERLSSGLRINRAADDPAGLAVSERMRAQVRGLNQARRNAQDGISLLQTAEGALGVAHDILQRIRELTVQAANDTYTEKDRLMIQGEIRQLVREVNRIALSTEFNTIALLDGNVAAREPGSQAAGRGGVLSAEHGLSFQVGANPGQTIGVSINDMGDKALGINQLQVTCRESANRSLTRVDRAIAKVSSERSSIGAVQNRLEHTMNSLSVASENLTAAESRIRDLDVAAEIMELIRNQILAQVAAAMLAAANLKAQAVLQLLAH